MSKLFEEIRDLAVEGAKKGAESVLVPYIKRLEEAIDARFKDIGYDYSNVERIDLFRQTTDERLATAEAKLAAITDVRVGIADSVKYIYQKFYEAIAQTELGHVSDFYMDDRGICHVEVQLLLHRPMSMSCNDKEAAEKKFEQRMEELRAEGYIIEKAQYAGGYFYTSCETNQQKLQDYFGNLGAVGIEMSMNEKRLVALNFIIAADELMKNIQEAPEQVVAESDTLTAGEGKEIRKQLSEIIDALNCLNNNIVKDTVACPVIESCLADISEIVGYKGMMYTRVKERHAVERAKNERIREIENQIGSIVPSEMFKSVIPEIFTALRKKIFQEVSFDVRNVQITKYGQIDMELTWVAEEPRYFFAFDEEVMCNDAALVREFSMSGARMNSDFRMYDNGENYLLLVGKLRELIPSIDILSFESSVQYGNRYFKKVTCVVNNIQDILIL